MPQFHGNFGNCGGSDIHGLSACEKMFEPISRICGCNAMNQRPFKNYYLWSILLDNIIVHKPHSADHKSVDST